MNIVYLSGSGIPSRLASGIQVMRMCEAFSLNGHSTTLISRHFEAYPMRDIHSFYGVQKNFGIISIPCKKIKGINLLTLPDLYTRLRQFDPREVLIYARDIYGVSLAARMGFKVIYEAHTPPYNQLIAHLESTLLRHPRFIRLVVITEALRRRYNSRLAVQEKIIVCHDAAALSVESWNGNLPWPKCRNTLQVGYTGHLYPGKGVEIVIECAKRLPHYDFHIIGGMERDIKHWLTRAPDNIRFHGFFEPFMMRAVLSRCDVLLLPCQRQVIVPHSRIDISDWMSPLKLFEYMASRKVIIASNLPVLREVLDERMAVLVAPDKAEGWVEAIRQCENLPFREALAQNAFSVLQKHYTWDKRAEKVLHGLISSATGNYFCYGRPGKRGVVC